MVTLCLYIGLQDYIRNVMAQDRNRQSVAEALERVRMRAGRSKVDVVELVQSVEDLHRLAKACPKTSAEDVDKYYGALEAVRRWESDKDCGHRLGELVLLLLGSTAQKSVVAATAKWQKALKLEQRQAAKSTPTMAASMPPAMAPTMPQAWPQWMPHVQAPSSFGPVFGFPQPYSQRPYRAGPRGRRGTGPRYPPHRGNEACYNCRSYRHQQAKCPEPKRPR